VIFWFFDCGANPACVIVIGGKGAKARDVEPNPRLEPTLPKEPPHTKEESHGYEKEKGKKEENEVIECASLGGAASSEASNFARSSNLAERLNEVRPLLLIKSRGPDLLPAEWASGSVCTASRANQLVAPYCGTRMIT
jgi:hypothetical protein